MGTLFGTCRWFALCEETATTTRKHPTLGEVPICPRCDKKIANLEEKTRD